MNDKSVLNKFAYHLVMHHKTIHYNELKVLSERDSTSITIPLITLISLYITDYDNINAEYYSKTEQKTVEKITSILEKDLHANLEITSEDLKNILKNCKTKRLPKLLHDKVCLLIAKDNNITYEGNDIRMIDLESLQKVLENLKYPQE